MKDKFLKKHKIFYQTVIELVETKMEYVFSNTIFKAILEFKNDMEVFVSS